MSVTPPPPAQPQYDVQPQQPYQQPVMPGAPVVKASNPVGLAALIVGIVAVVFAVIPFLSFIAGLPAFAAVVLGIIGLVLKGKKKGFALAGLILGVLAGIIAIVVTVATLAAGSAAFQAGFEDGVSGTSSQSDDSSDATDEPAAETDAVGTRQNPYPIGSVIESDEWRVVVNSVSLAATDAVVAANMFNEAPPAGSEYILVNYSVTYLGDDPDGGLPAFVSVEYVTVDGTTVSSTDLLAVAPDAIDTLSSLYTDGTVTGNTTMAVPSASAGQGVLAVRAGMLADKVFFAAQ